MSHLQLVALVVRDYDAAIRFFVDLLQFELVEDTPSLTNDGRPKRWVVVRPGGGQTGILLARADGDQQLESAGRQFAGRVGMFLRVDDFDAVYQRLDSAGVRFVSAPRDEPYGRVVVFEDLEGNRWDLLGPAPGSSREDYSCRSAYSTAFPILSPTLLQRASAIARTRGSVWHRLSKSEDHARGAHEVRSHVERLTTRCSEPFKATFR